MNDKCVPCISEYNLPTYMRVHNICRLGYTCEHLFIILFKILQYLLSGKLMTGPKHKNDLIVTATLLSTFSTRQNVTRMAWSKESSLVYAATQHEVSEFTYDYK